MFDPLLALCRSSLRVELGLTLLALAGAWLGGRGVSRRLGLGLAERRLGAGGVAWLVLGTLALSHALDALLELTGLGEHSALAGFSELLVGARGSRLLLALGALGLAPAIGEELLCRGLVQRAATARLGPGPGIALAAALFGALHLEPIHAGFAALLGLYLGLTARWAGHTWAAIVCHGVNNLAAVGLSALAWQPPTGLPSLALGLALAALGAERAHRRLREAAPAMPLQREAGSDDG